MKKDWMTVKEVARRLNITEETFFKRLQRNQIDPKYIEQIEGQKGGKSGINYLISPDYLLAEDPNKYFDYLKDRYGSQAREINLSEFRKLRPWQIRVAMKRYKIVKEVLRGYNKYMHSETPIQDHAKKIGKCHSTVYAWINAYEESGFAGLAPQTGVNYGKRISMHEDVIEFIRRDYLRPQKPSVLAVHGHLKNYCETHGYHFPCYSTLRSYIINDLNFEEKIFNRDGEEAWKVHCEPYIERDLNSLKNNEVWVADSREMDVFVYTDKERRIAVRPWIVLIEDMGSRKFTGYRLCLQPDGWQIALAFRDGFLRNGIPKEVYFDNGKDYTSYYLSGGKRKKGKAKMNMETESVMDQLNIVKHFALPYNPQSKPIEPAFRIFHRLEQECPGWCGRNNKLKPEKFEKEERKGLFLTFEEFHIKLAAHIEWYNNRFHKELGMSPNERRQNDTFVTIDERDLDVLLMKKEHVTIHRNGFHLLRITYWSDELQEKTYVKDKVIVRYNPDDLSTVLVFDRKDQFLCSASPQEKIHPFNATEKDMKKVVKRKSKAKKNVKNVPNEREIMINDQKALEAVMEERKREPENDFDQGPTDPHIIEKKLVKSSFLRADAEGRDPYGVDRPPLEHRQDRLGRIRPVRNQVYHNYDDFDDDDVEVPEFIWPSPDQDDDDDDTPEFIWPSANQDDDDDDEDIEWIM